MSPSSRAKALPNVPTIAESGLPGFDATSWFDVLAPAGTRPELVAKLHAEIAAIIATSAVQQKLLGYGVELFTDSSPAAFQQFIAQEGQKWGRAIKESGAKVD